MTARAVALLDHEDSADLGRWALAGAVVLAAHAGLIATYLMFASRAPAGAPQAPVVVNLAPMPVSPQSPLDVAPGPEMVEAPPPEPVVDPPPPPEPIIEATPPTPDPLVALPEPPKEPPPPEVKKEEPKEKPEIKPVRKIKPAPRTTAAPRSERTTADTPSAPAQGANATAAMASWRDLVVAQLQRAKRYPGGAESRREQGVVTLSFSLSRNGAVLSRGIVRGSGYSELDQEVLAMVMRAQPFPAFPASMPQSRVSLSVPIRFSLR